MANRHEVEGDIVMGWVDRKRPTGYTRKDMHGRVIYNRTPFSELQGLITPIDLRYIVAQLEMPDPVHPSDWKFSIEGSVERPITLTLEELQNMPGRTVRVVTECSGDDAHFFDWERSGGEVHGCDIHEPEAGKPSRFDLSQQHTGQASSGEFTGVSLGLVLDKAGLKPGAISVRAEGFDHGTPGERTTRGGMDPYEMNFDKCLPLEKALDPDTILAWALNGEYLRHVHGAPLRLIVPGWSGNWSVKWLNKLEILDHIAPCWYQTQYFFYADAEGSDEKDMITSMGVKSVITEPRDEDSPLAQGQNQIRGLAWSGEGAISTVEVSVDGGKTWALAHVEEPREKWLWVRWSYLWDVSRPGIYTIMARATDEKFRAQPQIKWNILRKNYDGIVPVEVEIA